MFQPIMDQILIIARDAVRDTLQPLETAVTPLAAEHLLIFTDTAGQAIVKKRLHNAITPLSFGHA